MVPTMPLFFPAEGCYFFSRGKYGAFKPLVKKVEGTGIINACIERVFGYKARVNRMLKAHSEIMTSRELILERVVNLEDVLSIKLSLKHSLSIFAIAHLKSPDGAVNDLSGPV